MVIHSATRDGSLRQAVAEKDTPILLYEAGEALYFNDLAIKTGLKGIINVMRAIGMLPRSRRKKNQEPIVSMNTSWVRASRSGVFYKKATLGNLVHKGDLLGEINDPLGEESEKMTAPFTGVVIGQLTLPLVHEGDALFNIAKVPDPNEAEELLDDFTSALTDEDFALDR